MEELAVITFRDQQETATALSQLKELNQLGEITDEGAAIGQIIGILAGPLGMLIGAGLSSATGGERSEFDHHFVKKSIAC